MRMFSGLLIGAIFGFALHRGGLVRYSRIVGTLLMKDFKAMNFMFSGLAIAAILYGLFDILDVGIIPRVNGYFGIGHIIGGVLFGVGMGISGLCPGTCAARFSSGKLLTGVGLLGIFVGVYFYDFIFPFVSGLGGDQRFITVAMLLDVRYGYLAIGMGAAFLAMCFVLDKIDPAKKFDRTMRAADDLMDAQFGDVAGAKPDKSGEKTEPLLKREWGWFPTGVIAGLCIVASVALGEYLSFASGFLSLGAHMASFFGHEMQSVPSLSQSTEWRAMLVLGLFPGTFFSSWLAGTLKREKVTPLFKEAFGERIVLRSVLVFTGGFLMIIGALIGGGCTTGAFMSAWPTLSVGSFAMGATFFMAAMATAHIMYHKDLYLVLKVRGRQTLDFGAD